METNRGNFEVPDRDTTIREALAHYAVWMRAMSAISKTHGVTDEQVRAHIKSVAAEQILEEMEVEG